MLWQRLQRDMSATLAETIKLANSYVLGDPMQPTLASSGQGQGQRNNSGAGTSGQFYRPDNWNKRRDDMPNYRYGSSQVAAIEESKQAPAIASIQDMRAISSLNSKPSNSNSHRDMSQTYL
jgi:hypothetical protein